MLHVLCVTKRNTTFTYMPPTETETHLVCVCVLSVCVHFVMVEPLLLSFTDADGGYKFITPRSRQPIILNTAVLHSHIVHICV